MWCEDTLFPATPLFDLDDVVFFEVLEDFRSFAAPSSLRPSLRGRGGLDSEVRWEL